MIIGKDSVKYQTAPVLHYSTFPKRKKQDEGLRPKAISLHASEILCHLV